jgi:hypothetical protein
MTAAFLLATSVLQIDPIFAPRSLIEQVQRTPTLIFGVLELCLAIAYLALWRAARDYKVFRTLGLFYAIVGCEQFWQYLGGEKSVWAIRSFAVAVLIQTAAEAMEIRNRRWTWLFWPIYLFTIVAGWFPCMAFVREWPVAFSQLALIILVIQGFRRGNSRDRWIAAAFFVHFAVRTVLIPTFQRLTGMKNYMVIGGWQWQFTTITLTSLGIVTLAIFVRDLIRDRREKQRLATELEAARAIQQLLIPEQIPAVPGFSIQSAYKPFGEVGGDFFQIIPFADHSALIAIGDVSGKGLSAAMQVSLLVGTLRALATFTQSPGAMLAAANEQMIGRSNGGFTTCLILRIDANGSLTAANAGHIAPYTNGVEFRCENGLPLGIVSGVHYVETALPLASGHQLTLLTDEVLEARNAVGELFGFERTADISTQSADQIAQRAQQFGQEDDITVLTLTRTFSEAAYA